MVEVNVEILGDAGILPDTHQHIYITYIQVRSVKQIVNLQAEMKSCGQSWYHLLSANGVSALDVMVNNVFYVFHVGSLRDLCTNMHGLQTTQDNTRRNTIYSNSAAT